MACLLTLAFGTLLTAFVVSKATPAWAIRYLAVFVGPMIPVAALGLSRGGRLGLVALALVGVFWVFDPVKTSLYTKSNLAIGVEKVESRLGTDPLIISTQPEQVPTLAYYLPHAKSFLTPLGLFRDPRIVDWRNALATFRHASVSRTLAPMIRSLTPGRRVLLVTPTNLAHQPLWMVLIRRANARWAWFLDHDRMLRPVVSISPHEQGSGLAVRVTLYVAR
jgi:hypothetical protein